jgi:hypothetical protein
LLGEGGTVAVPDDPHCGAAAGCGGGLVGAAAAGGGGGGCLDSWVVRRIVKVLGVEWSVEGELPDCGAVVSNHLSLRRLLLQNVHGA